MSGDVRAGAVMVGGEAVLARLARGTESDLWRGRRPPVKPLVEAMLDGDLGRAADLVGRFTARVGSRVAVFADLLHPAQYQVGDLWYEGGIRGGDEARAAGLLDRL